jgi:hypothetical protein
MIIVSIYKPEDMQNCRFGIKLSYRRHCRKYYLDNLHSSKFGWQTTARFCGHFWWYSIPYAIRSNYKPPTSFW